MDFIDKNCPTGQVPVFAIKGKYKGSELHPLIKVIFAQASKLVGHKIYCSPIRGKISVPIENKSELIWVFYVTPEERKLILSKRNRLMNFNSRKKIDSYLSCFAFNESGTFSNAFFIPIGSIKTDKCINDVIEKIKIRIPKIEMNIYATKKSGCEYYLTFSSQEKYFKDSLPLPKLNSVQACVQLALLNNFENEEIHLCDTNGNYYDDVDDLKTFLEKRIIDIDYYQQKKLKKMDEPSTDL